MRVFLCEDVFIVRARKNVSFKKVWTKNKKMGKSLKSQHTFILCCSFRDSAVGKALVSTNCTLFEYILRFLMGFISFFIEAEQAYFSKLKDLESQLVLAIIVSPLRLYPVANHCSRNSISD